MADFSIVLPETGLTLIGKVYNSSGVQQGSDVTMTESATNVYTGTYNESSLATGTYDEFPVLFSASGDVKGNGVLKVSDGVESTDGTIKDVEITSSGRSVLVNEVWDEPVSSHLLSGTMGLNTAIAGRIIDDTTATGTPTANVIQLVAGSATDDIYNNEILYIASGAGTGQARIVLDYDGTTKTITVNTPLVTPPSNGDRILIQTAHTFTQQDIKAVADSAFVDYDGPTKAELDAAQAAIQADIAAQNDLSQSDVRSALGLASANLDTQLDAIPTVGEIDTTLTASHGSGSWQSATIATVDANVTQVNGVAVTNVDDFKADVSALALEATAQSIKLDTGTTIPGDVSNLAADVSVIDNELAIVDANVDAILVDTGTTIPAQISGTESKVDDILTDTGTTLPGNLTTINTGVQKASKLIPHSDNL